MYTPCVFDTPALEHGSGLTCECECVKESLRFVVLLFFRLHMQMSIVTFLFGLHYEFTKLFSGIKIRSPQAQSVDNFRCGLHHEIQYTYCPLQPLPVRLKPKGPPAVAETTGMIGTVAILTFHAWVSDFKKHKWTCVHTCFAQDETFPWPEPKHRTTPVLFNLVFLGSSIHCCGLAALQSCHWEYNDRVPNGLRPLTPQLWRATIRQQCPPQSCNKQLLSCVHDLSNTNAPYQHAYRIQVK